MKNLNFILGLSLLSMFSYGQQNMVSVEASYAFADIVDVNTSAKGWRVSGLYEFNLYEGKITQGISAGYLSLSANGNEGQGKSTYDIGTIPIYYVPGLLIGEQKFKVHLKGALGWQFSNIQRTGSAFEVEGNDSGIILGAGLGGLYLINPKVFINLGYEFLWLQNSYVRDGLLSSVKLGIGFRF